MSSRSIHQVLVSDLIGGAGHLAIQLAAAAQRRGFSAHAWVPSAGPASAALEREGVRWGAYQLHALRRSTAQQLLACTRMIPGLLRGRRPVVHIHNPVVYRLLRPALLAAGAKTVVHFHIEPSRGEVVWTLAAPPDHVVVCARYIGDRIRAALQSAATFPITAVPNGIDVERYARARQIRADRHDAVTRRHVILMLANLAPHKGQATAIRATRLLRDRGVPLECWLAGEDRTPEKRCETELRSLVTELGLADSVKFLGQRSDGPQLLAGADVFLLPSTHEGLPLSVLEAQAAGTPVIGSPIPGIKEVVEDGVTGFVVPPADYAAYADRIEQLLADKDLRQRVAVAAADTVADRHAFPRLEQKVFDVYSSLN
jgi:glycosyltransferase involved in cell wall biosynthesis